MILYLTATSKNKIGYTPDTLIVENGGKRFEYDIQGWTDYDPTLGLSTRTKGELKKRDDQLDDYVDMTEVDERELLELLKDKNTTVIISIYPTTGFEDKTEELDSDELNDCSGEIYFNQGEANFTFHTEFYGI